MNEIIVTKSGEYSKDKFNSLIDIRSVSLSTIRNYLEAKGFTEVLTAVLVNIAGSCENPHASFKLPYYGRVAHLSQSAQIQLEKVVVSLKRKCFTVNNSFREENYEDPESAGRRLSEFTLIEPEMPLNNGDPAENMFQLMKMVEEIIKLVIANNLEINKLHLGVLGADKTLLEKSIESNFKIIKFSDALLMLQEQGINHNNEDSLSVRDEKILLKINNNIPFFITEFPFQQKFFNIKKQLNSNLTYSFDLIAPQLGETVGGGVREENPDIVLKQLKDSTVGQYLLGLNSNPEDIFEEYFNALFQNNKVKRGGFGIGFERLVGFLINSNDILNSIKYRSFVPNMHNNSLVEN